MVEKLLVALCSYFPWRIALQVLYCLTEKTGLHQGSLEVKQSTHRWSQLMMMKAGQMHILCPKRTKVKIFYRVYTWNRCIIFSKPNFFWTDFYNSGILLSYVQISTAWKQGQVQGWQLSDTILHFYVTPVCFSNILMHECMAFWCIRSVRRLSHCRSNQPVCCKIIDHFAEKH